MLDDLLGIPEFPRVNVVVAKPTPRIWELYRKPGLLTDDEWAELKLYENMQQEEDR